MAKIKAFQSIRPRADLVSEIAALPYDVYNRQEAREVVAMNPLSFLKIDRAETLFPEDIDMYSQQVYDKARDTMQQMIENGSFVQDMEDCYYIYELTMDGHSQTGLVGCASIDDYLNGVILKHENTREDKELDRINHVDTMSAQTGPIFLAYRSDVTLKSLIAMAQEEDPLYDFISEDGIGHRIWMVSKADEVEMIFKACDNIPKLYIADGHHRAASAMKVGLKRREANPDYDGTEEFNYFLSVSFPDDELRIFDYNRVVKDLNGYNVNDFLNAMSSMFEICEIEESDDASVRSVRDNVRSVVRDSVRPHVRPSCKGQLGMYLARKWYALQVKEQFCSDDPVDGLDVSILQNEVLTPLLGIEDPKTDKRIRFVGGIRGLDFLAECVDKNGDGVAFAMYPTSMSELLAVADAGRLMPPKSTWFEPKLRSGLFIHKF